jgi:2-polyprenyl-3-methyl-5-hydroxy-6-metoxy-1,4-benzoquinol methylase
MAFKWMNSEKSTFHSLPSASKTSTKGYLTDKIRHYFNWKTTNKKTALDVGCGAGQYAEILEKMGFEVYLLDASNKMLELARKRLKNPPQSVAPVNIFASSWGYRDESFDLIFASAIMIHVPDSERNHVYSTFYRLLKPDGYLFVNYKIDDHTLISIDGRYFAYYRDAAAIEQELKNYGFNIDYKTVQTNSKDMYLAPKFIQWANFYCTKIR